jgi:hypothetical protein
VLVVTGVVNRGKIAPHRHVVPGHRRRGFADPATRFAGGPEVLVIDHAVFSFADLQ